MVTQDRPVCRLPSGAPSRARLARCQRLGSYSEGWKLIARPGCRRNPARVKPCAWRSSCWTRRTARVPYNRELGHRLTREATELLGPDAILTIIELQKAGKLPHCVTPAWDRFMELAAAGDVEIATVILIRDREYVCEDRVAERVRQDARPSR